MILYILRHGESEGNKDKKFRGRSDFPLTERGKRQAEEAAGFLDDKEISIVYSSPLIRAYDTAKIAVRKKNLDVIKDEDFNNIFLGSWEGRPKIEIEKNFPEEWRIWTSAPESLSVGGMETLEAVQKRSVRRVNEIFEEKKERNVLIVSHRAVIKPLIAGLIGIEKPFFWKLHIDTAALSVLEKSDNERGWMLKNLNINHYLKSFEEERF